MVDVTRENRSVGGFCGWCRFFGLCSSEIGADYGDDACWEFLPDWPEAET